MSFTRAIFSSKITWALILILIFYVAFVFSEKYARILELKSYLEMMEHDIEELEQDTHLLAEKIDLLSTDLYIERIAREELDLVKHNEILFKPIKK